MSFFLFFLHFFFIRRFLSTFAAEKSCLKMAKSRMFYHVIALFTVFVWSVTFVSSKILLHNGLSPAEIFFLRFLLAYIFILPFEHSRLWCENVKDELLMAALGITGGSLYFLSENTALQFTAAGNVCLLVCSAPLMTAFLALWLGREEHLSRRLVVGSLVAFVGVALVVIDDRAHMQLRMIGDLLALSAALAWAFYQLLTKKVYSRYKAVFITRKVFAYGLLSILIYFLFRHPDFSAEVLMRPVVYGNLLFLGVVASCLCFLLWNVVIGNLGAVMSSNYLYLQPMIAMFASAIVLGEPLSVSALLGAVLIIAGVYWAEH